MPPDVPPRHRPFLTASWKHLVMLNYAVDPALLTPLIPHGTELDTWHGDTLISLVGFRFLDVRVLGFPIPGHRNFDEINLRFYVRRRNPEGEWRRGVVFIREIVPRWLIAATAKWIYDEPYVSRPMRHHLELDAMRGGRGFRVEYGWRESERWNVIHGTASGKPENFAPGSEAEFITEHYWGYTRMGSTATTEYHVDHPSWRGWALRDAQFEGDATPLYGEPFAAIIQGPPRSAFLALGSEVAVYHGTSISAADPDSPAA